jgi:PilZ domain
MERPAPTRPSSWGGQVRAAKADFSAQRRALLQRSAGIHGARESRYFRYPVEMATLVISNLGQELKVTATNLSEGGMAITFRGKWLKGVISKVSFTLPGELAMETKADLAWVDGSGHAGIRFYELSQSSRQRLERRVSDH